MKSVKLMVVALFATVVAAGCSRSQAEAEPVKATMTAKGETEYRKTPMGEVSQGEVKPAEECKNVLTCYSALARDLCLNNDPACTSSFEVTAPVSNSEVCENMLDRAKDLAKPFLADKPDYEFPEVCED